MNTLYIKERTNSLINIVTDVLHSHYPELSITEITPFANGVENVVFKGKSKEFGLVAIRTPLEQMVDNENDGTFHARVQLKKELKLSQHCGGFGIPVPRIYHSHFSDEIDFIISELIVGDQSSASNEEIGAVLSKLHTIPFPDYPFKGQAEKKYTKPIAERIVSRTRVVEKLTKTKFPLPSPEALLDIFNNWNGKNALLHLDVRPANYMTLKGEIIALIDWSNALIGDPCLEIMRILEQEELHPEFLNHYHFNEYIHKVPEIIQILYRYDVIVMMTVLFLSEIDDKKMGDHYFRKLVSIHQKLLKLL